jgi:mannosidase alpha-like ER degradation enhancer 1/mannosidase alpha-like ER degradation enhancer 2
MMKDAIIFICLAIGSYACQSPAGLPSEELAGEVRSEFIRTWDAYKTYAWGHDVLLPISKGYKDWYEKSLHISPIDAYSTMKVMGLDDQAAEVERYIIDSVRWEKDLFVKTFEVNIRILGGMLAMYQYTRDPLILEKTEDFGKRMLKAFESPTGIPYYWFNLQTGATRGERVNVAEAASYLLEMGILSYYTSNPVYYTAARKATLAVWERVSDRHLVGEVLDVETGEWLNENSHICAGIDSYYEYLYKAWDLFQDPVLKEIWDTSIAAIQTHLADEGDTTLWYRRVNMHTGEETSTVVTLYDAFFPAILAQSGDLRRAEKNQATWYGLWNKYGLEPMVYDYATGEPNYPAYDLNPEIFESAYYLYHITGEEKYLRMVETMWSDLKKYCRTEVAYSSVEDVRTMKRKDYMPTFFFAETLKYLYLTFTETTGSFNLDDCVFTTEAHPFMKSSFDPDEMKRRLGLVYDGQVLP